MWSPAPQEAVSRGSFHTAPQQEHLGLGLAVLLTGQLIRGTSGGSPRTTLQCSRHYNTATQSAACPWEDCYHEKYGKAMSEMTSKTKRFCNRYDLAPPRYNTDPD